MTLQSMENKQTKRNTLLRKVRGVAQFYDICVSNNSLSSDKSLPFFDLHKN